MIPERRISVFATRKAADDFVTAIAALYAAATIPVTSHWTTPRQARKLGFKGYWTSWLVPENHAATIEQLTKQHGGHIHVNEPKQP